MKILINMHRNINSRFLTMVLTSLAIVFALMAKWDLLYEVGLNNPIAEIVIRFAYAFNGAGYSDVLGFIGIMLIINKIRAKESRVHIFTLIISGIFAFIYICALSFMMYASMLLITRDIYQFIFSICLWYGATLFLYYLFRGCAHLLNELKLTNNGIAFTDRHIFLISFVMILIGWMFWLICTYPGTSNPDAIHQLSQFFSGNFAEWTTHHPPFSTFIMGTLVRFGQIVFKSADVGFFIYLLLQTVVGGFVFAYGVVTLQKYYRVATKWLIVIALFFALVPFWGVYASMFEKSLLYAECIVLATILIIPVVKNKTISMKRVGSLCIICIFSSLLRNNGIYTIVPLLVALIIYLKGDNRKKIILALALVFVTYYGINNIVYTELGIEKGSVAEALSLPFQQTAKYVKYYDDEITLEEKEIIDSVLDYDTLGERYNPIISNPVKETYKGDNSRLGSYLSVWVKMFFKHPGIYLSAFMDSSFGYIAPVNQSIETTTDFDYAASGLQLFGLTNQAYSGGVELTNSIRTMSLTLPILKYLCMPGLYTWILVLAIIFIIRKKEYEILIAFIPSVINILICIASPLSTSMRYAHPTVAAVPFLIGLTVSSVLEKR